VAFPAHVSLLDRTDFCFRGFDQSFPDFFRLQEWQREFDQQVKTNTFPNLTLLRLNHDHFGNFGSASFGVNTPELQMADNDYYVERKAIVSDHYSTVSMLRTIEDILGLDNLGVHDAGVPPMAKAFDTNKPDWTYTAVPVPILLHHYAPNSREEKTTGRETMPTRWRGQLTMLLGGRRKRRASTLASKTGSIPKSLIGSSGKA
jgi:hypothetical protein